MLFRSMDFCFLKTKVARHGFRPGVGSVGWMEEAVIYLNTNFAIMIINRIWPLNSLTLISSTFEVLLNKQVI